MKKKIDHQKTRELRGLDLGIVESRQLAFQLAFQQPRTTHHLSLDKICVQKLTRSCYDVVGYHRHEKSTTNLVHQHMKSPYTSDRKSVV